MSSAAQKIEIVLLGETQDDDEELILFKAKALYHDVEHVTLTGKFKKSVAKAVQKSDGFVIAVLERRHHYVLSGTITERSFNSTQIDFSFENGTLNQYFGRINRLKPRYDFE